MTAIHVIDYEETARAVRTATVRGDDVDQATKRYEGTVRRPLEDDGRGGTYQYPTPSPDFVERTVLSVTTFATEAEYRAWRWEGGGQDGNDVWAEEAI